MRAKLCRTGWKALAGGAKFMPGMDVVPQGAVLRRQDEGPGAGCARVDRKPGGRRADC